MKKESMSRRAIMLMRGVPRLALLLPPCLLFSESLCLHSNARADDVIDSPMYKTPDLPVPRVEMVFPQEAIPLWLRALERPEAEIKCKAANAIAMAQRQGAKGLSVAVAPLLKVLEQPDQHPAVRLTAAEALIALDARDSAPILLKQSQAGTGELRDVVEPALARWNFPPARAIWLRRLTESEHRHHDLVLAIRALGTIREERALERLRELVLAAQTHPAIRLEAAGALGSLRADGLEKDATRLTADPLSRTSDARLAAVSLLRQHRSPEAVQLLQRLTGNDEPSVAAGAAARLLEIDSKLLIPSLGTMLANPDSKVRSVGVEVLFRNPSEKHIELLGFGMDDVHPDVRMQARRSLHDLAKRNLREAVIAEGTRRLATGQWRALEQAAILLAQLDHKKASERLVQLLRDGRPEVFVAAAWGLRKLAVPETLPRALRHVEYRLKQLSTALERADSKPLPTEMIDHQLSQLNQFLGQHKYPPAEPVLRRFIPQPNRNMRLGHESRAAAIWALGLIHEGKNDPELATALEERLNHTGMPIPPEDRRVRWMCAIALGRMQAKATLPSLRKHYLHLQPSDDRVNNACGWAIEQIAGEVVPPPRTIRKVQRDWFLTPRE